VHGAPQLVATLEIGGLACGLACHDRDFSTLLVDRYHGFLTARPPELSVEIDVSRPGAASAEPGDVYARVGGDHARIVVAGLDFHGVFDQDSGRGRIVQPPEPAALETLLTAVYAARLLREGGCLLHAAALVRDGLAYVFHGPSGSGKTTVAALVGDGVITDEIAVIRPERDGWRVSGVPWRGTPLGAPLAGFCRLRQASSTRFRRLAPARAVPSLLACAFFARPDAETQAFLDAVGSMVTRVPVWDMEFRRDREFWTALPRGVAA
jgi:hypothetical protein